jgi:hypothetical protein
MDNYPRISTGNRKVIHSGVFITWGSDPTVMEIAGGLKLIFAFANDKENPGKQFVTGDVLDDHTLRLTMTNFNNILGTGTSEPVRIGETNGKDIHLAYRVHAIGGAEDKTVQYTVYQDA